MLLPPLPGVGEHIQELASDKEKILMDQPGLLCQFGVDILPVLIQVGTIFRHSIIMYLPEYDFLWCNFLFHPWSRWLILVQT